MYQHQIYIGTNVTPAFLFFIKCPEAFVSLWSKAEFLNNVYNVIYLRFMSYTNVMAKKFFLKTKLYM